MTQPIGRLTFGSFLLLLMLIALTGMASVIDIRHIGTSFAELMRVKDAGDFADDIDRQMSALRLAAHDLITDPARTDGVARAASELSALLTKTRPQLAPEAQSVIDGVDQRLAGYRDGIALASTLSSRRAEQLAAVAPLRARLEQAVRDAPDGASRATVFSASSDIASALLANDPAGAGRAAERMKALAIDDPVLGEAVNGYAQIIIAIAGTESEIASLDRDVLGTGGGQIGKLTELLRERSAREGRMLAQDFAGTVTKAKWHGIVLSTIGMVIGTFAASFVIRRTVRPLSVIASSARAPAAGDKSAAIPAPDVGNEVAARALGGGRPVEKIDGEESIAEARLLLQVIDTVPVAITVKDRNLRYVLMNRYMAEIFGIEPSEAIGRTVSDLMSRDGAGKVDDSDERILETKKGLGAYEEAYRDSAGAVRHWLVNKLPALAADGEVAHIVTVALDIDERKRNEQEMRDATDTALRNLRETGETLVEAEKLAALGRLVAGVAHEVNNPIGISLTVASALERRTGKFIDEVAQGELKRSSLNDFLLSCRDASSQLVGNLNRAAELIQSFKQVAADRNHSDHRTFDLANLTQQVLLSLRAGLRKQNLTLTLDCQPGLVMNSHPGPYGQALTNLFLNSIAHAFPDDRPGAIMISAREAGTDKVEITFADDGVGMSRDVRRHAFDPFFTTRRGQGGTGLGLHIVRSIVTSRLGGQLDLDSEPGAGTRITMILPRTAPLAAA